MAEELGVESNLLLADTDISIHFGQSINASEFISLGRLPYALRRGILNDRNIQDFKIRNNRIPLTRYYMDRIYSNIRVNMDHVVCQILRQAKTDTLPMNDLLRKAYLAATGIVRDGGCQVHRSLRQDLVHLVSGELYEPVHDVIDLATGEGSVVHQDANLLIDRNVLSDPHTFHDVRLRNTISVLANEVEPVDAAMAVVRDVASLSEDALRARIVETVTTIDQELFESDYAQYYDSELSKDKSIGRPYFLDAGPGSKGVLLSHGYLGAPEEVRPLAEHLHAAGLQRLRDSHARAWHRAAESRRCALGGLVSLLPARLRDSSCALFGNGDRWVFRPAECWRC